MTLSKYNTWNAKKLEKIAELIGRVRKGG